MTEHNSLSPLASAIAQAAYPDVHPDFTDAGWERMAKAAEKYFASPRDCTASIVTSLNLIAVQCEAHQRAAEARRNPEAKSWEAVVTEARAALTISASIAHKKRMPAHLGAQTRTVSGDAVKTDPALPNGLAADGSAGEVIGRTPWRVLSGGYLSHDVADAKDNILFSASPGIAHMAVTAVNAWTKLFGDCTVYRDVLRALQAQLIPLRSMPANRRALQLIDTTLHPDARQ